MKKQFLEKLIESSIDDRKKIRQTLEDDRTFQRCVPYQVKEVFYKLYDASLDYNYRLLKDIKRTRTVEYTCSDIYEMYNELDEKFLDFCFEIVDYYKIKGNILM